MFDVCTQSCLIEIGAWAYMSSRMNLSNTNDTIEQSQFSENGEWDIVKTKAMWGEVKIADLNSSYSKVSASIDRYIFINLSQLP